MRASPTRVGDAGGQRRKQQLAQSAVPDVAAGQLRDDRAEREQRGGGDDKREIEVVASREETTAAG